MKNRDPKRGLAIALFKAGEISFDGPFVLASGKESPFYICSRGIGVHPRLLRMVIQAYMNILCKLEFDLIVGLPEAMTALIGAIGVMGRLPYLWMRSDAKKYGRTKTVEGSYSPGMRVAILDNVITNGDSKLRLAQPLADAGLVFTDFVVLIDREQGGREALEAKGYRLHAVMTVHEMLKYLVDARLISLSRYNEAISYLDDECSYRENLVIQQEIDARRAQLEELERLHYLGEGMKIRESMA